ncbi:MAG: TetR/AcrR family transcriptional regulator [Actinobacteria bacterium]|nr:TetR/AcrR family transcriptional regulator [Actinomycetota bacterium]
MLGPASPDRGAAVNHREAAVPHTSPDALWAAVEPEASRRMLVGAVDAFAERGYHATTTRDIAARAGLSPAALYVHYPSKAALLAQISSTGHEAALALVEAALARGADPVERLRLVVADFVAWHATHHRIARVVQYELGALPDDARAHSVALRRRIEGAVGATVADGVRAGVMTAADPRRVARAVLSLGIDVARWYDPAGRDSPAALGALYADLATRMVGAAPAGGTQ